MKIKTSSYLKHLQYLVLRKKSSTSVQRIIMVESAKIYFITLSFLGYYRILRIMLIQELRKIRVSYGMELRVM